MVLSVCMSRAAKRETRRAHRPPRSHARPLCSMAHSRPEKSNDRNLGMKFSKSEESSCKNEISNSLCAVTGRNCRCRYGDELRHVVAGRPGCMWFVAPAPSSPNNHPSSPGDSTTMAASDPGRTNGEATMSTVIPDDVLHIICEQIAKDQDFATLFNCVLTGRRLAEPAIKQLYRYVYLPSDIGH